MDDSFCVGAGNEARTRDLNLGKVALYQLSYSRVTCNDLSNWCPGRESNPYALFKAADFKSAVSTSFTTRA